MPEPPGDQPRAPGPDRTKMMRSMRANHYANRSRVRRALPRDVAADLVNALELSADERKLVLALSAEWSGANDILSAAAGPREPIGELLVKAGRITRAQLDDALAEQRGTGRKLGEILVRGGLLSAPELRSVLAFQQRLGNAGPASAGPLQLGNLLVSAGIITPEQLALALEQHRSSRRRLGDALVHAGYATEHQVAHGLRLQQIALRVALAVLLALSLPPAIGATGGGTAHNTITFSATVLPYHKLEIVRQAATLNVTPADLARGYVDVPAGTALRAQSNDEKGFTFSFDPRTHLFLRVTIMGLGGNVDIGPEGGAAHHAYSGRDTALELSYRFYLASGLAPGSYPWPLQISSSVTY
jgi:hypothetical protein